jgi:hypothetical protein
LFYFYVSDYSSGVFVSLETSSADFGSLVFSTNRSRGMPLAPPVLGGDVSERCTLSGGETLAEPVTHGVHQEARHSCLAEITGKNACPPDFAVLLTLSADELTPGPVSFYNLGKKVCFIPWRSLP